MHENDDLPHESVADGFENDDESNGQELDPDQVRFVVYFPRNRLCLCIVF